MCKDTSLLQRSNISIEKPVSPLALQRSAMFEVLENGVTNLVPKTLRTQSQREGIHLPAIQHKKTHYAMPCP